jgi:hypothetical protein
VNRWCDQWHQPRGYLLSLPQQWSLAQAWNADRMEMEWRRKTEAEIEGLWQELGLTSPFWDIHF